MGRLRDAITKRIERLLDVIDPPEAEKKSPRVPCPSCSADVSEHHDKSEIRNELIFYRCECGWASAWYWNGHGPQLIYGQEPAHDEEVYEDFD